MRLPVGLKISGGETLRGALGCARGGMAQHALALKFGEQLPLARRRRCLTARRLAEDSRRCMVSSAVSLKEILPLTREYSIRSGRRVV